jgi:hypothetical protein
VNKTDQTSTRYITQNHLLSILQGRIKEAEPKQQKKFCRTSSQFTQSHIPSGHHTLQFTQSHSTVHSSNKAEHTCLVACRFRASHFTQSHINLTLLAGSEGGGARSVSGRRRPARDEEQLVDGGAAGDGGDGQAEQRRVFWRRSQP